MKSKAINDTTRSLRIGENIFKVIHLVLVKKWFDLINSGEKKEEYRAYNEYWKNRILELEEERDGSNIAFRINGGLVYPSDAILAFHHGYSKDRSSCHFYCKGVRVCDYSGREEWGFIPGEKKFIIEIGDRVE